MNLLFTLFWGFALYSDSFLFRPSKILNGHVAPRRCVGKLNVMFQQSLTFVVHDGDDDKNFADSVDATMLSSALMELGATSVTCEDEAKGTSSETPVFRHNSMSPTWRGDDPGIMNSRGVVEDRVWQPSQLWKKTLVTANFPSSWDPAEIASMLQVALGLNDPLEYQWKAETDDEIDWVSNCHQP